jgi:hypothetical protein
LKNNDLAKYYADSIGKKKPGFKHIVSRVSDTSSYKGLAGLPTLPSMML